MVKKEFAEELAGLLRSRLSGVDIWIRDTMKNNGICYTGVVFGEKDSNVVPCIYLDPFYSDYQEGNKDMDAVAEEVVSAYYENRIPQKCDFSMLPDYSRIRHRLQGKLVNTEKNAELLEHTPHREIFDLSLTYYVEVMAPDGSSGEGSIRVEDRHLQMWGVTEEDLYGQTMENLQAAGRASVFNMADILGGIPGIGQTGRPEGTFPLYILTNCLKWNGAAQLLNERVLEEAAGIIGSDFYILPSSVHEMILVPAGAFCSNPEELAQLVREVNDTVVREEDYLSSHVYRYCAGSRQIRIAA